MSFELIPTPHFEKEVKRIAKKSPSIKSDVATLAEDLLAIPSKEMKSSRTATKFALRLRAKEGKRGGGRLITSWLK